MLSFRRAALVLMIGIAAVGMIGSGVWAAAPAGEQKIGVVDSAKVYQDAPRIKQYQEQLDAFKKLLTDKLDIRAQNLMLDENEIKELVDLKTKDKPTDADNGRIKQLTDSEAAKDNELKALQQNTALNEQAKARLTELQNLQQKSKDTGAALVKDYDAQYKSKYQELNGQMDSELQAAVKKVAETKGLPLVLDKAAVMVGGIDITDAVIQSMDRKMN